MKILFLLLQMPSEKKEGGMYVDLAAEFKNNGHDITLMAPDNNYKSNCVREERNMKVVRVASRQTQGVSNMIKKGIALATISYFYKCAYKKYLSHEQFDLVLMPTPPITLTNFVLYVKRKTKAKFYLILRDIHPQSIASIGILKNKVMYRYLDVLAKKCYKYADYIGCMSEGNISFIKKNNPSIEHSKILLLYNWISDNKRTSTDIGQNIRKLYGLNDKVVVLYGGNLGVGQKIENIVKLAEHCLNNEKVRFVVIGKGIELQRLQTIIEKKNLTNVLFIDFMPQSDYLEFVSSVDIGLVSINEKYKVPTCPSKAVSYMALGIPVFAIINPNNDYGTIIENAGAGYWVVGNDDNNMYMLFDKLIGNRELRNQMGGNGRKFYEKNCTTQVAYKTIIKQLAK